jgi:hypothetical protein
MKKTVLIGLVFLSLSLGVKAHSAYYYTVGTLEDAIRVLLRDDNSDTTKRRWSDAQLLDRINLIQQAMVRTTLCLQDQYKIETSSTTREYRLPADCLKVYRVSYDVSTSTTAKGNYYKLPWTSVAGLDSSLSTWEDNAAGKPQEYYERENYIGINPIPNANYYGPDKLKIDYVVNPSSLTASSDIPFNDDYSLYPFHEGIIYGVVSLCLWSQGEMSEFAIAEAKYKEIMALLEKTYNTQLDRNTNFTR